MVDIPALKKALEELKPTIEKNTKESLTEQKALCDKINKREFDAAIRTLFTKEEMIKFLNDNAIPNNLVEKAVLEKAVGIAIEHFKGSLFKKIEGLITSKEIVELFEKYGVKFDSSHKFPISGTPKEIIDLFVSAHPKIMMDINYSDRDWMVEIQHHYSDIPNPIIGAMYSSEFYKDWASEHFLVKDASAAIFELVY